MWQYVYLALNRLLNKLLKNYSQWPVVGKGSRVGGIYKTEERAFSTVPTQMYHVIVYGFFYLILLVNFLCKSQVYVL